ncbi:MAG: hypothetical protein ACYCQK_01600 [Acidiferrobacteraceae bacterium]
MHRDPPLRAADVPEMRRRPFAPRGDRRCFRAAEAGPMTRTKRKSTPIADQYRQDNGDCCEIAFFLDLGLVGGEIRGISPWDRPRKNLELHHIWSVGRRPDLQSNMLMVSLEWHKFFHRNLRVSRVICCSTKIRKAAFTLSPREFSISEIDEAAGKSALGVVEGYEPFDDRRLEALRMDCIRKMRELKIRAESA